MIKVDKRLLLRWTRDEVFEIIKRDKLKAVFELKNKKGWLGFLSNNAQIQLTQSDVKQVEEDLRKLIKAID